jgi:hypothetical protein
MKKVTLHGVSDEDARSIQWDIDHGNAMFFHSYGDDAWQFEDITIEDETEKRDEPD